MQFLKTLFWVMVAVVAVIFSLNNWVAVPVKLWGPLVLEAKLPVLLGLTFLIGFLPTWAVLGAGRWRLKRRVEAAERALADVRAIEPTPPTYAAPTPVMAVEPAAGRPLHAPGPGIEP